MTYFCSLTGFLSGKNILFLSHQVIFVIISDFVLFDSTFTFVCCYYDITINICFLASVFSYMILKQAYGLTKASPCLLKLNQAYTPSEI